MFRSLVQKLVWRRTIVHSLLVALVMLAYSGGVASLPALAAAPSANTVQATAVRTLSAAPAWLAAAMPYVHVKNLVATIDPRIRRVLPAGDVAMVERDVARYNATPLSARSIGPSGGVSIPLSTLNAAYSACYAYLNVHSYNWWGVQFFLNDCFAQDLALGVGLTAAASAILLLVPGIDVLVAVLVTMLGVAAGSILWADHHCGNRGVYLNVPWLPAAVWGSTIC
ncbi:MAG TPA: hypothetical protein VGJ79_04530 [Candidatus Dormibacteraeota bacterium]